MSGAQELSDEMRFVVDRLIAKVFQGDQGKRGLAVNCASVALAALQDHTAATIGTMTDADWERVGEDWAAVALEHISARDVESIRRLMELRARDRDASVTLMEDEI